MAGPLPRLVPGFLGLLGAVFGGVGVFLLLTDGPRRESTRAETLPAVSATQLASLPPGTAVLLEGRIAPTTPVGFRDFVAWRRERFEGVETSGPSKGREIWKHVETVSPPLRVTTATGEVPVVNDGYDLRAPTSQWRETTSGSTGIFDRRPEGATGFRAGDRVIVDGRVVLEPGLEGALPTRAVQAAVLSGGDRVSYLASLREGILAAKIVGGVFAGVAVLLLALSTWLFRRAARGATESAGRDESPPARRGRRSTLKVQP